MDHHGPIERQHGCVRPCPLAYAIVQPDSCHPFPVQDGKTDAATCFGFYGRIVRTIDNVYSNSVTIHRDNLPGGISFIRIHSDDTYVKKVIIR